MILKSLKSVYDYNMKHSTILYKIVRKTILKSVLSYRHRSNPFRTHIKKSADDIARLTNYLKDDNSKQLLNMIVNARTRNVFDTKNYSFITQPQYFIEEVMTSDQSYTLIDAGAYTGDTIESFISLVGKNYEEIISFEPDPKNLELLKSFIKKSKVQRVKVVDKGLWSNTQMIGFADRDLYASKIDLNSMFTVKVVALDDYFKNTNLFSPIILKMDIEGAEPFALIGAENFINKYRPVMAICIYHEAEHLFEIPFYIQEKHPFYEFLIRHHSNNWTETVLYCLPIN